MCHEATLTVWQNVYFVAPVAPEAIPSSPEEQWNFCMNTPGCIELTWNYGSEKEEGLVYNTGNSDSTGSQDGQKVRGGLGHLGITVPDVYEVRFLPRIATANGVQAMATLTANACRRAAHRCCTRRVQACERFQSMGYEFTKTPNSGGMKGLAFVKDPDGYLVEVLPQGPMITKPLDCAGVAVDGGEGYKDNSK